MKTTTYFKPSIHGWAFGNSFSKSFYWWRFEVTINNMGFCAGMCWSALYRFYNGTPILRTTVKPNQGTVLYDELWDRQIASLNNGRLWEIYKWQMKPERSSRTRGHSQGHLTQEAWKGIKRKLNASQPVTITLIASANDANPAHLSNSHRVVAYAYEVITTNSGPKGAKNKVTIWIYDPNCPNNDNVYLTFFLGAEKSNIRLRHSIKGSNYRGLYMDDVSRVYNSRISTPNVEIVECKQTGFISKTKVNYDFKFSWECYFIPYFNILINGQSWKFNQSVIDDYHPILDIDYRKEDNKQCPSNTGNLTISLELPRAISTVAIKLLGDNTFYESFEVDALPELICYPKIRVRFDSDRLCVNDTLTKDTDLFIKNSNPSDAEIRPLDVSEFRWVVKSGSSRDMVASPDPRLMSRFMFDVKKRLGNIIVPIYANFIERNLALPIERSGVVNIIKNGSVVQTVNLNSMSNGNQKIFDGFNDNPADYDNDTLVEFKFESKDATNLILSGEATFHGKSILWEDSGWALSLLDPVQELLKQAKEGRMLVERGIVGFVINPPRGWHIGPQMGPDDPIKVLEKIMTTGNLQSLINKTFEASWNNTYTMKKIWKTQLEFLNNGNLDMANYGDGKAKMGKILKAMKQKGKNQQKILDTMVLNIVVDKTIKNLLKDPKAMKIIKSL